MENKGMSLTIHYRNIAPARVQPLEKELVTAISRMLKSRRLKLQYGKKIWEIRPAVRWDKGKAVLWLLRRLDKNTLPIYIGDDTTDEDAFVALHKRGITVRIGKLRGSRAEYSLRRQSQTSSFLRSLREAS
jgi:trehalose-phosphatase